MSLHLQITTSNEVYDLDLEHTARNKVRAEVATIARDGLWIGDDEFIPASQIISNQDSLGRATAVAVKRGLGTYSSTRIFSLPPWWERAKHHRLERDRVQRFSLRAFNKHLSLLKNHGGRAAVGLECLKRSGSDDFS